MFSIEIHNVGQEPKVLRVTDADDRRRPVAFFHHNEAEEAVRIIRELRMDTAFIKAVIIESE